MMKDMQKMQNRLMQAQSDLRNRDFEAEAGGGMVHLTLDGDGKLKAVDPEDVEALEDLIVAAFQNAFAQRESATQELMGALAGGLKIPGL